VVVTIQFNRMRVFFPDPGCQKLNHALRMTASTDFRLSILAIFAAGMRAVPAFIRRAVMVWLLAGSLGSLSSPGRAAEIHVSPRGDDSAPGNFAQPVRTLGRAQELIRNQPAPADGGNRQVILHRGVWRLTQPLTFGPADGRVTWRAAEAGAATISGGRELSGWQVNANGSWHLHLPEVATGRFAFRELFVNGRRATRARTPNEGYFRIEKAAADRRTGFTFKPGEVRSVPDLEQVELVFFHDWSISRVGVKSVDVATSTLATTDNIGGAAVHYAIDHFEPHPRFILENSASYLDAPGEWFLDRLSGRLTYRPLPGEDPASATVVVPVATQLIAVSGNADQLVTGLHFDGIHFEHCAWAIPERGYVEGQANYHEPRTSGGGILRNTVPAALQFQFADNCSVSRARISQLGGWGISFGQQTSNCVLRDSVLTDLSGNGVFLGEDTSRTVDGRPWWQAKPEQAASRNVVENCLIERCGQQFHGAVGVWVGFTQGSVIRRNEIRDLPYTGVSLGWRWDPTPTPNGNNLVAGNHIHHVMQVLSDGGGIYTLGRQPGTVLRANHIHDIPVNLGRAESNGMFIDEGSTGLVIEDNAIYNLDRSPLRFHKAGENVVRNNLLVVQEGIPHIRYNNTPEANIQQTGNVIAKEHIRQP
jgi:hypothetical protein